MLSSSSPLFSYLWEKMARNSSEVPAVCSVTRQDWWPSSLQSSWTGWSLKVPFNLNYSMIPCSALLLKQRVPLSGDKNVLQKKNAEKIKASHLYFWLRCPKPNCSTYIQIRQERKFETNPEWGLKPLQRSLAFRLWTEAELDCLQRKTLRITMPDSRHELTWMQSADQSSLCKYSWILVT